MPLIEIVVVEAHVGIFLFVAEGVEDGLVDGADARMVHLRLSRVFDEEHVADNPIEPVANPHAVLVGLPLEELLHLPLGAVLRLQVVHAVGLGQQEVFAHILGMDAEGAFHDAVVDIGLRVELFSEGQAEVLYLAHRERQCG